MTQIRLFVDDERTAFDGWVVARTASEALDYFQDFDSPHRIVELSLDWYMGMGEPNGDTIAREIIERVRYGSPLLSEVRRIYCHSSDRAMALKMARMFEDAQRDGLLGKRCRVRLNTNCRLNYGVR